jgi:hypothetical protein
MDRRTASAGTRWLVHFLSIGFLVTIVLFVVHAILSDPLRIQFRWFFRCAYPIFGGMLIVAMIGMRGRDLTKDLYPGRLAAALAFAAGGIVLLQSYHEIADALGIPSSQLPYFRVATLLAAFGLASIKPLQRWLFAPRPT